MPRQVGYGNWLRDQWGSFVGPENSAAENALTFASAALGCALSVDAARRRGLDGRRRAALGLASLDLWGGAVANNTRSCARWYERPGQGLTSHLRFAAAHLHPFLVAWVDRSALAGRRRLVWALAHYLYLLLATWAVRRVGGRLRRPAAVAATGAGVALDVGLGPSAAAPWFAAVFYIKLLLGHAGAALWSDARLRHESTR